MSADLERDLSAWAAGALSRERLLATYGAEAAGTVALHERLTGFAAGMPVPDADAGWAALVSRIEAPAPAVPLRRHGRPRRTVSLLLVAAALVAGGAAFAAVRAPAHDRPSIPTVAPSVLPPPASWAYGPNDRRLVPPPNVVGTGGHHGGTGPAEGGGSDGPSGATNGGSGNPSSTDHPLGRDHGTGNDGTRDDNGSGNDGPTGTSPPGGQGQDQGDQGQDQGSSQGN